MRKYGCEWCTLAGDREVEVADGTEERDTMAHYIICDECGDEVHDRDAIGRWCPECAEIHGLTRCKDCGRAVPKTAAVEERDGADSTFYCPACARERTRDRMDHLGIVRSKVDYLG